MSNANGLYILFVLYGIIGFMVLSFGLKIYISYLFSLNERRKKFDELINLVKGLNNDSWCIRGIVNKIKEEIKNEDRTKV